MWCDLSWGRRLRVSYNCNGVSFLVTYLACIVEVCENPTGVGRGFSPQLGQRCFSHKNTMLDLFTFMLICIAIPVLDSLQTP